MTVLRIWEADIPAGIEPTLSRYRGDQRNHPEWPAPETIRDHGPWEMLRDEAVRRNRAVTRGEPNDFVPLPARANRGEEARQLARALHVEHAPGHRKRADGARVQVADLLAAGLLTAGEEFTGRFKGTDHVAIVEPDGQLRVIGKSLAGSPSHAEKLASGHPKNGWRFWWVDRDGQRQHLEASVMSFSQRCRGSNGHAHRHRDYVTDSWVTVSCCPRRARTSGAAREPRRRRRRRGERHAEPQPRGQVTASPSRP